MKNIADYEPVVLSEEAIQSLERIFKRNLEPETVKAFEHELASLFSMKDLQNDPMGAKEIKRFIMQISGTADKLLELLSFPYNLKETEYQKERPLQEVEAFDQEKPQEKPRHPQEEYIAGALLGRMEGCQTFLADLFRLRDTCHEYASALPRRKGHPPDMGLHVFIRKCSVIFHDITGEPPKISYTYSPDTGKATRIEGAFWDMIKTLLDDVAFGYSDDPTFLRWLLPLLEV